MNLKQRKHAVTSPLLPDRINGHKEAQTFVVDFLIILAECLERPLYSVFETLRANFCCSTIDVICVSNDNILHRNSYMRYEASIFLTLCLLFNELSLS